MSRPRIEQSFKPTSMILKTMARRFALLAVFVAVLVGVVACTHAEKLSTFANYLGAALIVAAIFLLAALSPLSRSATASSKEDNGATTTMDMRKSE